MLIGQTFYATPAKCEVKGYWCHPCYAENKSDELDIETTAIRKTQLDKRRNDEEVNDFCCNISV